LAGHVHPLARFQRGWSNMSDPLVGFQRGWPNMSSSQPGHVWVSEGIGLPIYQPIYWLTGFHPPPPISWPADLSSHAPPDSRPNPAAFHPAAVVFFGRLPALPPHPVYQLNRRFRPVFAPPPSILVLPDRLQLLSRPKQMGNEESTLLPSWGDRIPYT
jgi:hypothetical protein